MNFFEKLYNKLFKKKNLMLTEPTQTTKNENNKSLFEEMIKVGNQIMNNESKLNFKDEVFKILELDNDELKGYVDKKINSLNKNTKECEISLEENEKKAYKQWINTNTTYLPSGNRSKGFKITNEFFLDWCKYLRENLGRINTEKLKVTLTDDKMIQLINMYQSVYFGEQCIEKNRKEIFGYGNLNSIGETLNIEDLKNKNVARCIEKSGGFNALANFIGFNSSLVVSDASINSLTSGHAYCVIKTDNRIILCDPNFFGVTSDQKRVPFIFEITGKKNQFDSKEYGDSKSQVITYDFPFKEFPEIEQLEIEY